MTKNPRALCYSSFSGSLLVSKCNFVGFHWVVCVSDLIRAVYR
jgi:hypothetical protein